VWSDIILHQREYLGYLQHNTTTLRRTTGSQLARVDLCAALLKSLDREYQSLIAKPEAHNDILRRFEEQSSMVRGKRVRVEENGGFEGITEGLDSRGFLRVRTEGGVRIVYSGTVRKAVASD